MVVSYSKATADCPRDEVKQRNPSRLVSNAVWTDDCHGSFSGENLPSYSGRPKSWLQL